MAAGIGNPMLIKSSMFIKQVENPIHQTRNCDCVTCPFI